MSAQNVEKHIKICLIQLLIELKIKDNKIIVVLWQWKFQKFQKMVQH